MAPANSAKTGVRPGHQSDASDTNVAPSDTGAQVPGLKSLAEALGVARSTVYEWRDKAGCPGIEPEGGYDVAKWKAFAQTIGSKTEAGQSDAKTTLQNEELRLINEQRRKKIERDDGLWTLNAQIDAELAPLVQEAKAVLRAKFENELPTLYSPDPAVQDAARALNKAAIDEVCARLSDPLPCQSGATDATAGDDDE